VAGPRGVRLLREGPLNGWSLTNQPMRTMGAAPPGDSFAISADVRSNGQFRYLFSPDAENKQTGFIAAFINYINEFNIALMRDWEFWCPPYGHHVTIPQYSGAIMNEDAWYRHMVQFRPDRLRLYFGGRMMIESPNFCPQGRHIGIVLGPNESIKDLRVQRLVE
jgi:hypothetical protein